VTVNATFLPFCSMLDICPDSSGKHAIGMLKVHLFTWVDHRKTKNYLY
jgi:hypothetical protein